MPRGVKTHAKVKAKLITKAVEKGSIPAAAQELGLSKSTAYEVLGNPDDFGRIRTERLTEYVLKMLGRIELIAQAIDIHIKDPKTLAKNNKLTHLTRAVADLKKSIDTSMTVINLQINGNPNNATPDYSEDQFMDDLKTEVLSHREIVQKWLDENQ